MAHLWIPDDGVPWAALELEECPYDLDHHPPARVSSADAAGGGERGDDARRVVLAPAPDLPGKHWLLRAGSERRAWVNGVRVDLGLRVLEDRDLVRLDSGRGFYFSTEDLARRQPFPGGAQTGPCPRCKKEIEPGSTAVRCPHCGVWHHQGGDRDCWTYAPQCATCDRRTDLDDAGFQWVPDGI
jgi:hypothetical protein